MLRNLFFVNTNFYVFQMPVFLIFLNTRTWQWSIRSSIPSGHHQTSARPCFLENSLSGLVQYLFQPEICSVSETLVKS